MKFDEKILIRFEELIKYGTEIRGRAHYSDYSGTYTDREETFIFGTSTLNLIERILGKESAHYTQFNSQFNRFSNANVNSYQFFDSMLGTLKSAKDDYENGYLFDTRALIEAEVFDDFLEQAEHLLNQGYFTASAVIAGSVLEDGLRNLCMKKAVILPLKPKLDTMNADLAKAGVYNLLKQKQITALADLRNKAAHGLGGFSKEDVEGIIKDVRRFTADYFS